MAEDIDTVLLETEEHMEKAFDYLKSELKGVRTGRASTGLVEFVKVEAYGAESDVRSLARVSVPEPTQILIKPFDPSTTKDIVRGIEAAGLGLNPQTEGNQIRLNIPPLSGERRQQLIGSVKHMGEEAKVAIRNARRDGNKHVDQAAKTEGVSEDQVKAAKDEVQDLTRKYESKVDEAVNAKVEEVQQV